MELEEMQTRALEIKQQYRAHNQAAGHDRWGSSEYLQGMVGDVGDLAKLVMAKNNFRQSEELDEKIAHELADCLWSVLVLADELDVDIKRAFLKTMQELETKLQHGD